MGSYGERGEYAFLPVSIGLFLGAGFVSSADFLISSLDISGPLGLVDTKKHDTEAAPVRDCEIVRGGEVREDREVRQRVKPDHSHSPELQPSNTSQVASILEYSTFPSTDSCVSPPAGDESYC